MMLKYIPFTIGLCTVASLVIYNGHNHQPSSHAVVQRHYAQATDPNDSIAPPESSKRFEFRFFLRKDLEQVAREQGEAAVIQREARITRVLRLPCGAGAMAKVSKMPSLTGEDSLSPDKVVEVDAQNNTLQRWAKPVDSQVIAIAGSRILVKADNNQSYWIDSSGTITTYTETDSLPSPENIPYIKHPEFAASGVYSQRLRDLNSDDDRRIIAEASCT